MRVEWMPVTRFEQNCAIVWCEATSRAAVVDPGGDVDRIRDFVELLELEIDVVLVTHGHFDHAGGAAELAAATGARIEGPNRGDEHLIRGLHEHGAQFGVQGRGFTPDRWLNDGDRISVGEVVIDVVHCPGHTQGHVAYFHEPSRFAFVGDTLFLGAIGSWESAEGDLPQLLTSIRSKLFPLGDDVRFLPGHGDVSSFGHERLTNPFVGEAAMARWRRELPGE
jgi:hydroxyacylglutathione hydrolase